MSIPQPKTALNNVCSVIFNNTLYTYSADAFQSLRLEPGEKWQVLPQGEKVTGGVCVGATTGDPSTSAFFVVGGEGRTEAYQGLQKYTYATGQWETISLPMPVTHQRRGHSAVYLNSSDSILVYAGVQDGSNGPSSHTFTIGASAPHAVVAYESSAPPAVNPILLPWSTSEAVMIGGSTWNTQVSLFSIEGKWVDSGASLAAPLPKDTTAIQAALITGDDGSKNLITFDTTESPNLVKRTVLYSAPGVPVPNAAPVAKRMASRREELEPGSRQRRAVEPLTLDNWPAYNSTLAPKTTRTNYALAQGPDGMIVIAGGTGEDVLSIFNARENTWEDPAEMLAPFGALTTDPSSSTRSSTTSTATSISATATSTSVSASTTESAAATETPTETAAPGVSDSSGTSLTTILGSVLGGFFGLAMILAVLYLCIAKKRRQLANKEAGRFRRASGASMAEKDGLAFAKETLALGQEPIEVFRRHQPQGSQSSFSSMAILMGKAGQHKSSSDNKRDSSDEAIRAFKSTISKPIPPATPPIMTDSQQARDGRDMAFSSGAAEPRPRTLASMTDAQSTTRRSSGWNRYWSGGSALNILGFGSGAANNNSRRTTVGSDGSSHYSDPHRLTQDSATVPPLRTFEPRLSFSRVTSRSPTIAVSNEMAWKEAMSGQIETHRPVSAVSEGSASAYSSGIPESVQDTWDPTAANKPWGADRSLSNSSIGIYSTPLAPASQAAKPPAQSQQQQAPIRDDMSWLNLGG